MAEHGRYPDNHPALAEMVTVTSPEGTVQLVPRDAHEQVLAERDDLRRALGVAAAAHHFPGRTAAVADVDAVLARSGFDQAATEAFLGIVEQARAGVL